MASVVGNRQGGDQRRPPAPQERQQDQDAEQAADQDGVAHVVHGGVDEASLVVDDRRLDVARRRLVGGTGGQRQSFLCQQLGDIARDVAACCRRAGGRP